MEPQPTRLYWKRSAASATARTSWWVSTSGGRGGAVFEAVPELLRAVREAGARTAVVSASENCATVLAAAGLTDAFDVQVDGNVAIRARLAGKPSPATYLYAARMLGVVSDLAAVVEDAPAGRRLVDRVVSVW